MKKTSYLLHPKNLFFISIVFVMFFGLTRQASAASLLFSSSISDGGVAIHQQFKVTLQLDPQGSVINALESHVTYPHDLLRLAGIEDGNSFLTMWLESPHEQNGFVSLSGVAPGGFGGVIDLLAYPKVSAGDVVTLVFDPLQAGVATISVASSTAFLNDGSGLPAPLSHKPLTVTIENYVNQVSISNTDVTPPDFVYAEAHYDATLGGEYLFFVATDKESGIDHYEIQTNGNWVVVQSPYLINQDGGVYYIKAIDRAGNERIKEVQVPASSSLSNNDTFWTLIMLGLLVIIYLVYRVVRKWSKK